MRLISLFGFADSIQIDGLVTANELDGEMQNKHLKKIFIRCNFRGISGYLSRRF
jgi:hypothetical protein